MTTDDDAMLSVVEDVARTVARRVRLFIDVSSTSLRATRNADQRLGAIGVTFLDAAVYGAGVAGAKAGTSPIVVSGPRAAFEEIAPAIDALGVVTYVGKLGSAKIVKILNNLLVGAFAAAAAEIIGVGRSAGLSLPLIVDSMKAGSGSSYVLERYYGNYLESGAFGLGLIPISYMVKDLTLACDLAQEVRMPATMTEAARQLYQVARGLIGDVPFPQIYDLFAAVDHFDPGARA
jgi:3-hydroxyisobutyrate dehydrogenase